MTFNDIDLSSGQSIAATERIEKQVSYHLRGIPILDDRHTQCLYLELVFRTCMLSVQQRWDPRYELHQAS